MSQPVRTAVFPVAGRGTRFLPATKAIPKEMLPIVDRPLIQYAVEEAVAAGARRLIFITAAGKAAIEDHFDVDPELEKALADSGKEALLEAITTTVPADASCIFIRQGQPFGLGHAVLCARAAVGDEPFFVHLPDDLISGVPCLDELRQLHADHGGSVIAVEEVPPEKTSSYGIVELDDSDQLRAIVEKPDPTEAPSNLAVVGRYLLSPRIFDLLETTERGAGGEIQLTDGIASLLAEEPVRACRFSGRRYDCGNYLGFVEATVDFALRHPSVGPGLKRHLQQISR